jgi:2-haloacid dehalogenase
MGGVRAGDISSAVLRMLAATRGISVSADDDAELTSRFATMPPHPEVPAALKRLRDHGFRLFTLTDNTLAISGRQLEHGGIIDLFEHRFSVDETVRRHKPAPEAYHSVATALDLQPAGLCLIASHVWDTIGAGAAGWQSALILRPGNAPLDVGPQPDYIGDDLDAIATQLIERYPAPSTRHPARSWLPGGNRTGVLRPLGVRETPYGPALAWRRRAEAARGRGGRWPRSWWSSSSC